jgi:hypothetical protein
LNTINLVLGSALRLVVMAKRGEIIGGSRPGVYACAILSRDDPEAVPLVFGRDLLSRVLIRTGCL